MLLVAALLVLSACGTNNAANVKPESPPATNASGETIPEASPETFEPTIVIDATAAELPFDTKVEKVACIVSLCVDILAELGMEPIAIAESGVRTIATSPEFFGSKGAAFASIGGSFFEPSLEDLVALQPDLIIGLKGVHDPLRDGLAGIAPLYLAGPNSYQESIEILETMGKLTGKTVEAEAAKQRFLGKLAQLKEKSPQNKTALIMFGSDANFSIVTASNIGGTVLAEVTRYPWKVADPADDPYGEGSIPYSLEKLLIENPDVIFVESYSYSPGTKLLSEQLAESPIWSKLKAVQDQQVHEVRSPIWGDGRGTRSLGILLDEAVQIIYPDVF